MIAAHSRVLGPAIGGCRMKAYPRFQDAVDDVLRLSMAMTYKCAVAGMRFGGGKSVIALDRALSPEERRAVLLDHADLIASLGGSYLAGPDVGTGPEDMLVLREKSPYAFCVPEAHGGTGSSSGPTAAGVLAALRARAVFGDESMAGRRVVISGFGAVGAHLATSLAEAGARLTVSDVDESKRRIADDSGFTWADPAKALEIPRRRADPGRGRRGVEPGRRGQAGRAARRRPGQQPAHRRLCRGPARGARHGLGARFRGQRRRDHLHTGA